MSPKALSLAQGYSCTTSTTFPQGFGQRYAYLQMTLLPTLLSSCRRTQRPYRKTLMNWPHGRTDDTNKCVVLTVSGKKVPIQVDYTLHGQILARVKSAKYLGVTLTEVLKWGPGFWWTPDSVSLDAKSMCRMHKTAKTGVCRTQTFSPRYI